MNSKWTGLPCFITIAIASTIGIGIAIGVTITIAIVESKDSIWKPMRCQVGFVTRQAFQFGIHTLSCSFVL